MKRFHLEVSTDGQDDIVNISAELNRHLFELRGEGVLHLFVVGSTAALTTVEYEPGLVKHVAEEIAWLRDVPFEDVARATTENFHKLFGADER